MALGVVAIFVLAIAAPGLTRLLRGAAGWVFAALPAGLFAFYLSQVGPIAAGETRGEVRDWVPRLGVSFAFHLDGLSLLFALLITGVGALIVVYSGAYLRGHAHLGRFFAYLLGFMGSMLGLVLADDIITLFVFWELTSLTSYLLIGFDHQREAARKAALQALLVTAGGGLALLAGLILMGSAAGTARLSELPDLSQHAMYLPILLLVLAGAFTKSAQFPFHFWLPSAMEAPTPVSAYLHSSTMVKAGIYLLARLNPSLGGTDEWMGLLTLFGAATMLIGGYLAVTQTHLKRILAYSTVSALGALVMLLGFDTPLAAQAAVAFLLAHALYKGTLFLVAGFIERESGERDITRLGGLARLMPISAIIALAAGISMAGLPPLFGFLAKELLLDAAIADERGSVPLTAVTVLGAALTVAAALIVTLRPFFGPPVPTPRPAREPPPAMILGPAILAALGLVAGLAPAMSAGRIVFPAADAILGRPVPGTLALWHGLTLAAGLGAAAIAAGFALYALRPRIASAHARLARAAPRLDPESWYDDSLAGLARIASVQTRILQSGQLRHYLLIIIVTAVGLVGAALWLRPVRLHLTGWADVLPHEAAVAIVLVASSLMAVLSRSLLGSVAALGGVGFTVTLLYALFSAPDLAMTQFAIETLTVILLVLVLYRLPPLVRYSRPRDRAIDAIAAIGAGAVMSLMVLMALEVQAHESVSAFHAQNAVPRAFGRNIVNVILVDFRSLDTLGEITVLMISGIGVFTLLRLGTRRRAAP